MRYDSPVEESLVNKVSYQGSCTRYLEYYRTPCRIEGTEYLSFWRDGGWVRSNPNRPPQDLRLSQVVDSTRFITVTFDIGYHFKLCPCLLSHTAFEVDPIEHIYL